MHGIRRTVQSPAAIEARRERERSKVADYTAIIDDVLYRKKRMDYSQEALDVTTKLIHLNPELYTAWNYRRLIFLNGIFPDKSKEDINTILAQELNMTTAALKVHPKVYWIWNHRMWCLETVPDGPGETPPEAYRWKKTNWDREMLVIEKMLDIDSRNFHAWNYRRYALANMPEPRPETDELGYTARKIESNFSNFSAWHQRSKVLSSLWDQGKLDPTKSRATEFELVRNAIYTDPNDQSAWVYHRWLIGSGCDKSTLDDEIQVIQELLDEQSDSKWCMESLVHYKSILIHKHGGAESLRAECLALLKQLGEIDPLRKARYIDLAHALKQHSDIS